MVLFQFASSFNFRDFFTSLQEFGVYDYILPFLLVFAIIFAILEKTQIFGEGKTNVNAVIAIVVGLLLVVQRDIVEMINLFLPRVSLIIIVILMLLLVLTLLGGKSFQGLQGSVLTIAVIVSVIAVVLALSPTFGYDFGWLTPYDRSVLFNIVVALGVILLVYWMVAGKKGNEPSMVSKFFDDMGKSLRGGKS